MQQLCRLQGQYTPEESTTAITLMVAQAHRILLIFFSPLEFIAHALVTQALVTRVTEN